MPRTNIKTGTVTVGESFEELPIYASNVVTIFSAGTDLYVCAGVTDVAEASDAGSFLLPAGAALEMQPVPNGPLYVKAETASPVSFWYA